MRSVRCRAANLLVACTLVAITLMTAANPVAARFDPNVPVCAEGVAPNAGGYVGDCEFQNGNRGYGFPDNEWIRTVNATVTPNEVNLDELTTTTFYVDYQALQTWTCEYCYDPATQNYGVVVYDRNVRWLSQVPLGYPGGNNTFLFRTEASGSGFGSMSYCFGPVGSSGCSPLQFTHVGPTCASATAATCEYQIAVNYDATYGWAAVHGYQGDFQVMLPIPTGISTAMAEGWPGLPLRFTSRRWASRQRARPRRSRPASITSSAT